MLLIAFLKQINNNEPRQYFYITLFLSTFSKYTCIDIFYFLVTALLLMLFTSGQTQSVGH